MKRPRSAIINKEPESKKNAKSSIDRINGWLEDQYERHKKSSPVNKKDWYDNESDLDPDNPSEQEDNPVADGVNKSKTSAFQYSKEVYDMKCEWSDCIYQSLKVDDFVTHVSGHSPQQEQRDSGTLYCCLWDSCGFDSKDLVVVLRHINYHSYHTKIKAIGSSMMKRSKLPDCALDYAGRNLLPVLPIEMTCEWDNCGYESNNFQMFLNHVHCHVKVLSMRGCTKPSKKHTCEWRSNINYSRAFGLKAKPKIKQKNLFTDCKKTFGDGHKLKEHTRTHTQEKLVGCPVCGTQFSNKTKFYDHCKRQTPDDKKGFKCSHCRKNFATERILRDHIRLHVNLFKCPMCDMTCPFQSTLALHIRYRHLDFKSFQCNFCEHRSKTQRDLENHQLTHCSENFWVCEQEDCDYSCRSKNVLEEHYAKNHTEDIDPFIYCCHICSNKYRRGAHLTVHLKTVHSYRWASGHSRFKYIRGDDGIYRLQTVRYESIEVTKEMMKAKTNKVEPLPRKKYTCTFESPVSLLVKEDEDSNNLEVSSSTTIPTAEVPSNLGTLEEDSSDTSTFEESLKKYLGLTGNSNFIKIVKSNQEKF